MDFRKLLLTLSVFVLSIARLRQIFMLTEVTRLNLFKHGAMRGVVVSALRYVYCT